MADASAEVDGVLRSLLGLGESDALDGGATAPVSLPGLGKPLAVGALCFFARFVARQGWAPGSLTTYVKEARAAGVATVDITDRAKLVALLKAEAEGRPSKRQRGDDDDDDQPAAPCTGLLPCADVAFDACVQVHDRNSVLHSGTKVGGFGVDDGWMHRTALTLCTPEL